MEAAWQVDHWHYAVTSMQRLAGDNDAQVRSAFDGPILLQGSPEAAQFLAQVQAALAAARPQKAALDAAYQADLRRAVRLGTTYKGQLVHGKNTLPAEARFVAAAPNASAGAVQMEFRVPPGYVYRCAVRLADSPPVGMDSDGGSGPKEDLALGYLGVTDPKFNAITSPSADFRAATMAWGADGKCWLHVQDGRLSGNMTMHDFQPPYFFSGQQAP